MTEFQCFLKNVADALKSLAAVVEGMSESTQEMPVRKEAVAKVEPEPEPVKEQEPEPAPEVEKKEEPVKAAEAPKPKRAAGEPRRRKIIRTGKPVTAAETVYQIIKSKKGGIDTSDLMKETNFDEKKVRNIIYKLKKQEKIKTAKRGVYVAA